MRPPEKSIHLIVLLILILLKVSDASPMGCQAVGAIKDQEDTDKFAPKFKEAEKSAAQKKDVVGSERCRSSEICNVGQINVDLIVPLARAIQPKVAKKITRKSVNLSEENCGGMRNNGHFIIERLMDWKYYVERKDKSMLHYSKLLPWTESRHIMAALITRLQEKASELENLVVICDESKTPQAIGLLKYATHEFDGKRYLEVDSLVTSPFNLEHPSHEGVAVRGAGSKVIEMAIMKSKELGYEGRIFLESTDSARDFYQKIGLKLRLAVPEPFFGGMQYYYDLSAEDAALFLKSQQQEGQGGASSLSRRRSPSPPNSLKEPENSK